MLKKLMQKAVMLAGLFLAFGNVSHAAIGLSVSSTTNIVANSPAGPVPFIFPVRPGESVTATLYSTAPLILGATVNFEYATNSTNWTVFLQTATGMGGFNTQVTINYPNVQTATQFRWNVLTTTNSQGSQIPVTYTIKDNDDTMSVVKNSKAQDSVYFNDDSMSIFGSLVADRYRYAQANSFAQVAATAGIVMSSYTQLGWGQAVPFNKAYGQSVIFTTNTIQLDRSFVVLTATGTAAQDGTGKNGITLSACPTITTETATNGDRIVILCQVSSITFTDDNTITKLNNQGSALKIGGAATSRACGIGDVISFVFWNGFWEEEYFSNVTER